MTRVQVVAVSALFILGVAVCCWGDASEFWRFPELPPPGEYGNLVLDQAAGTGTKKPVIFSHWTHRMRYACRVCHTELGFEMVQGMTSFSEEDNLNGEYCGACHNGKEAFSHRDQKACDRCHGGRPEQYRKQLRKLRSFPKTPYGNKIDWVRAVNLGLITPQQTLQKEPYKPVVFDRTLNLEAAWTSVPPVVFPHKAHNQWLDCSNCHPDIFNVKKKTTKHFSMNFILEQKFCGVCHWKVAFPLDDCKRCHPGMQD